MGDQRPTAPHVHRCMYCEKTLATEEAMADRAASDAREDRLREALERIADVCGGNESMMVKILVIVNHALADVPPRSDR